MDAIAKRLTARYLAAPDPAAWLVTADRLEELGEAGAALWRRRGELYRAVREQFDDVRARSCSDATLWRVHAGWTVGMARYPRTVRVSATPAASWTGFALVIHVNPVEPASPAYHAYVVGRLLGLIDRLDG